MRTKSQVRLRTYSVSVFCKPVWRKQSFNLTSMVLSDIDDFIVDEEGRPISRIKKKKHIIHDDA